MGVAVFSLPKVDVVNKRPIIVCDKVFCFAIGLDDRDVHEEEFAEEPELTLVQSDFRGRFAVDVMGWLEKELFEAAGCDDVEELAVDVARR